MNTTGNIKQSQSINSVFPLANSLLFWSVDSTCKLMALQMKSLRHIMLCRQSHARLRSCPFRIQDLYNLPTDRLTLFFSLLVLTKEV
jgi:hypothetical protein